MPARVGNRATGVFRNLLQVGTVLGDVHMHQPRWAAPVVIAVWLPALVAVFSLVPADSALQAPPSMTSRPPSSTTPSPETVAGTAAPTPSGVQPPVRPVETRTVVVQVPGAPVTVLDGLRISVKTVGFTSTHDGSVDCGGGGTGPGGGGCIAIGGDTSGTSVIGVIDYSVLTPAVTCTVSSVHVNESAVVSEPDGRWTRIVVLGIGPNDPNTSTLPVSFDISRGQGQPVPASPKVCVPG